MLRTSPLPAPVQTEKPPPHHRSSNPSQPRLALIPSSSSSTPSSNPRAPPPSSLDTLPADILLHIVTQVHNHGAHHTVALAQVSRRLAAAVRRFGRHGDVALPVDLSHLARRAGTAGIAVSRGRARGELRLRKTRAAGDAFVLFDRCVAGVSASWRFRIERFRGLRIEVGVATPDAFRFKTVERRRSWSFDCFGRVCLGGERRAYGRRMREGDEVGVLYDAKTRTLSFLDGGVCMGAVRMHGAAREAAHLLPYVYLPYHEGEEVTLLRGGGAPVCVEAVRRAGAAWKRPRGLPYEGAIIVQTWQTTVWYAIVVDPKRTTLAQFWDLVEQRHGMDKCLFELIYDGKRLGNAADVLMSEVGLVIDARSGTSKADVLLSVPHVVS